MMTLLCAVVSTVWGGRVTISPTQALNEGGVSPITVTCAKGDGTSNPAISSGQLRLYQAASGKTTGNTITFSSENKITSIVFTFANNMTADNGVFSEGSYDSNYSTWTGSTNSVTLTVTGTKSGERIYITEMVVIYEGGKTDIATLNSISPTSLTVGDAEVFELDADFVNENYTIAWSCNDDCLSVDDDGSYEAISAGTASVTVTVTPTDTNNYIEVSKSFDVTVSPAPVTFNFPWSEDFSNNSLEGYVVVNGDSDTEIYNANYAGGTAPELLIGKNGGKFKVTINMKGNYGNMTLTFKANYDRVTVSATGGTVGTPTFSNKSYSIPITVEQGTEKLTLTFTNSNSDNVRVDDFNLELSKQDPGLLFAETSFTVEPGADFTAPTLTNPYNLSVVYSSSNEDLAIVGENTGEVIIGDNEGLVTITASFAGNSQYNEGSASYTIQIGTPHGTQDNPYTVAEARAAIDAGTGVEGVYATGTVSKIVTPYNSQYGNITYDISADGTTTGDQLRVYRGKSYNGVSFTSEDDIQVGDVVVIYGKLIKYNDIYEFAENNKLVTLYREVEPSITVNTTSIDVPAAETEGTIGVTFTNVDPDADIVFYEADGTTETTCDWIVAEINGNNIKYLVDENEGEARTAYFKVYGLDNDENDVYSELITITQAAPVAPGEEYVIDFESDAASYVNWEFTNIVSYYDNSGVPAHGGSKYGSTAGKESGSIQTKETVATPQNLTCYVSKQTNNTTESTWYIQVSEDGSTWKDVESISASSMAKGEWVELSADLSDYTDVYVRVYYSGTTAIRLIDDLNLSTQAVVPQPYTVTITQPDNAEIFVFYNDPDNNWPDIQSGDEVLSGSEVMVSTSASEGYQIESVTVTDENEQEIELTEAEEGISWTFIMPSSDVTISCTVTKEPTGKKYVKVTSTEDITSGKYLIVYEEGSVAFDGSRETLDATSNIQEVVMNNNVILTDKPIYFTIDINKGSIRSASGKYIGVTSFSNGLGSSETNGYGKQSFSIDNNGNAVIVCETTGGNMTLRFNKASDQRRFRYYNSEQQSIQLYKAEDEPFTFTISDRATDGETCYATIADLGAGYFKVEGNVEVSTVVINENKQLSYPITFKENDVLPGQGAYLVKGAAGEYTFPTAEEGDVPDIGENMLISTGMGDVSADDMLAIAKAATNHEGDFKFYKLSLNGKGEAGSVGFYWGAAKGLKFNYTKAHQAFLAVPQTGESIESGDDVAAYLFDGDKTGIYNVMATESESNDDTYTLSGIRVENKQLPKGIYIKNGKKVVVR